MVLDIILDSGPTIVQEGGLGPAAIGRPTGTRRDDRPLAAAEFVHQDPVVRAITSILDREDQECGHITGSPQEGR